MKINEVESLVGITKKNIRFYEDQGLLSPKRNSDNGYRDYGEEEVEILKRIKVLRKLGLPIEEIRQMLNGTHTVGDGMRRHLISLEREQRNLEQSVKLCQELKNQEILLTALNMDEILDKMEEMERTGTSFQNKHKEDVRIRYVAPVIITILMVTLMTGFSALMVWAYRVSPEEAPPMWFLMILIGIFAAIGVGVILALLQRIREIVKGEIDDAKFY